MLKPDYIDIDKDGNTTESMKKAAKERDMKYMGGLLQDDREQYVVGGIASRLARLLSRKSKLEKELMTENMSKANQTKTSKDIKITDEEIEMLQKQIDEGSGSEAQAALQQEMSEVASKLKARGFSDDRIDELLEEAFENRNYSELEEALSRTSKQEGGPMSMDDQMKAALIIPMEEKENMSMESEMPMESDDDMEDNYTRFIMDEALTEEEEDILMSKLEQDEELAMIFDKIIDVAQEFAGAGPVEGPGSGVSDSIPARLSDGEFVFTAKAVEEIGADNLMAMMKDAEIKADKRQGLVEGGLLEQDRVVMEPEKEPMQQDIRVTKETTDSIAAVRDEEDLVGDTISEEMIRKSRYI